MTSSDLGPGPELHEAVDAVETNTEAVWAEAARVSQLAFTLRDALNVSNGELARITQEIAGEQERLREVQREHAETTNELAELTQAKDVMLAQLSRAQDQLSQVLLAMDDLVHAQDTLRTVMSAFVKEPDADADVDAESGRPMGIGRIMDLGGES